MCVVQPPEPQRTCHVFFTLAVSISRVSTGCCVFILEVDDKGLYYYHDQSHHYLSRAFLWQRESSTIEMHSSFLSWMDGSAPRRACHAQKTPFLPTAFLRPGGVVS